jgi:hypothetical protein
MIAFIGLLLMLHVFVGRLVVVFLPMYWAYNVAQRGDSFGYALVTYFGNVLLLWLIWGAVYWVLDKIATGVMFSGRE